MATRTIHIAHLQKRQASNLKGHKLGLGTDVLCSTKYLLVVFLVEAMSVTNKELAGR